ncbi:MAG: hypothetical protein Q7T21_00765 [Gallionella sp.]|nr:hypothetical protein [Gallionella sp.]
MPTSRLSSAKDQQVIVICDFATITAGDISGVLAALKSLSGDRSTTKGTSSVDFKHHSTLHVMPLRETQIYSLNPSLRAKRGNPVF